MKKYLMPALALAALIISGYDCSIPSNPTRLAFANDKEPGIWEYLEDANCDINSPEAQEYVECMYDVFEEWDNDYTLHTDDCDEDLAKVPGCDMNIVSPAQQIQFPQNISGRYTGYCEEQFTSDVVLEFSVIADFDTDPMTVTSNTIDYGCDNDLGVVSLFVYCSTGSLSGEMNDQGWFTGTRVRDITTEQFYDGVLVGTTPFLQTWPITGTIQADLSVITICMEEMWPLQDMIDYGRESFSVSWGGCIACPIR